MTIDASRLTIDVQEGTGWRRTLRVTIPADLVQRERAEVARTLAGRLKLPGFRAGKIPARVVEQRFGPALNREMVDRVVGEAYREALRAQDLHPISEGEVETLDYEPDQPLSFAISFDVRPEIELSRLGGFAVERPSAEVGDTEVDKVLERLREQNGSWSPPVEGHPVAGDLVAITAKRLDGEDGEDAEPREYDLVLGEGDAIPDVESAIYTLTPGEEGEFTVAFPDDFPNEERQGQQERLLVTLRERKTRILPELDDAFARSIGDFEDLETLRARVREDLEKEAREQAEATVRGRLLDFLLEANPFEVPSTMVDRYLDSVLGDGEGADPERLEQARTRFRPEADRAVKRILLIERIAATQSLQATDDEIDARIEEIAARNDSPPAEVYARLQKSGRIEQLEQEITERKVFDFLSSTSDIQDART
jgi:trigger factor